MATANHKIGINFSVSGQEKVEHSLNSLASKVKSFAGSFPKIALGFAGLGGVLTAGGFTAGLKNIADLGGSLSDVAARTDMAAGEVMLLQQVFKNAGIDASALQQSMAYLSRSIASAKDGNDAMVKTFAKLGLTWEQLYAMRPADRFRAVSAAIGGLKNTVDKTDVSMSLFSKSGAQLLNISSADFSNAERVLGGLPAIMEKSAGSFDKISDAIGNLPVKSQQFFAGFLSQVDVSISSMLTNLESLDLTGFGELVGGKFRDAFAKFADGDIWGGMTSGMGSIWDGFKTGFEIFTDLADAAIKDIDVFPLFEAFAKGFTEIVINFPKLFWKQFKIIGENIGEDAVNALITIQAQQRVNSIQRGIELYENRIAKVEEVRAKGITSLGFDDRSYEEYKRKLEALKAELPNATMTLQSAYEYDENLAAQRKEEIKAQLTDALKNTDFSNFEAAIDRVKQRLGVISIPETASSSAQSNEALYALQFEAEMAKMGQVAEAARAQSLASTESQIKAGKKLIDDLKTQSFGLDIQAGELESMKSLVEQNDKLLNIEKYAQKAGLMNQMNQLTEDQISSIKSQNTEIERQIGLLEKSLALMTPEDRAKKEPAIQGQIATLTRDISSNDNRISRLQGKQSLETMSLGVAPDDFMGQINKATVDYANSFGAMAMQVGGLVTTMSNSITSSLGGALTGIIMQTKSVGEAFEEMGLTLLNSIVSAIMSIVAQLVVAASIIAPLNLLTGGALGGMMKMLSFGLFAEGGRVSGGQQLIGVNEEGSEFIVSAKSPRSNDRWLEMANRGVNLDDAIKTMSYREFPSPATSAGSSGKKITKQITVRTNSQLRDEWKRGGVIELVREGFMQRGWA